MLLLEAIDMAGFGNWTAVADHVGTKTKDECKVLIDSLDSLLVVTPNHLAQLDTAYLHAFVGSCI